MWTELKWEKWVWTSSGAKLREEKWTETKSDAKRKKRHKTAEKELTYLLISAWSDSEKEGSEHWRKRRQRVWSCCLSILLFSLPLSFSVTPSNLIHHPSLPFSSFTQQFFLLFIRSHSSSLPPYKDNDEKDLNTKENTKKWQLKT